MTRTPASRTACALPSRPARSPARAPQGSRQTLAAASAGGPERVGSAAPGRVRTASYNMHTKGGHRQEARHRLRADRATGSPLEGETPPLDDARIGRNIHHQCGWRVLPPPTPLTLWRPHLAVRIPVTQSVDGLEGHHPPPKVRGVCPSLMPSQGTPAAVPDSARDGQVRSAAAQWREGSANGATASGLSRLRRPMAGAFVYPM
jgi:hypothetical protein